MIIHDVIVTVLSFPTAHYISNWRPVLKTWHLILMIKTNIGLIGIGEGTPYWSIIYEDYRKLLNFSKDLKNVSVDDALKHVRKLASKSFDLSNNKINYGAFLALESALLDILAKAKRKSVAEVLGGVYRDEVPVAGTVFLKHPLKMAEELENWIRKGVDHIKFKIPCNLDDLEFQLKAFRDRLQRLNAENVVLRADANECFDRLEKARRALEIMERYRVDIVEQPMPRHMLKEMAKLRRIFTPSIKLMVDESLRSPHDIDTFAELEVADIVNFHPSKLGCLTITREAMLKAMKLGLEVQIGSALMTDIGLVHYLNLAASLPKLNYPLEEIGLSNIYGYGVFRNPPAIRNGSIPLIYPNIELDKLLLSNLQRFYLHNYLQLFRIPLNRLSKVLRKLRL